MSQANMNQYLMQEISQVKNSFEALTQQMQEMKLENTKLKNKIEKLKAHTNKLVSVSPHQEMTDLPIVVYDLTHQPPIVQNANPIFCSMLGYNLVCDKKSKKNQKNIFKISFLFLLQIV